MLGLAKLPVFADEAIYIHWSQSALRDSQYLFLPMLDGKPPLHSWMLMPFVTFSDPVVGGRLLSLLLGLASAIGMVWLVRLLKGNRQAQLSVFLLSCWLPYWFFHAHLALAEMLLTFAFIGTLGSGIQLIQSSRWRRWVFPFAFFFGMSLWTKTTALFFIPVIVALPFALKKEKVWTLYVRLGIAGIIGTLIFLLLRFSPLFPSLFSRSEDYTFTVSDLLSGEWQTVLFRSTPMVAGWLIWYLTPFALFFGLLAPPRLRRFWILGAIFAAPIIILGRVITPRYLFPVAVPWTILCAFGIQRSFLLFAKKLRWVPYLLLVGIVGLSLNFDSRLLFSPDSTPFVKIDRRQYLEDWSSGHGTVQVANFLKERSTESSSKIVVGTEGYFGSLPDGLSIYFFNNPAYSNVRIEGVGQPIREIPGWLQEEVVKGSEVYIVANSNRLFLSKSPQIEEVMSFQRPNNAPSLLLLRLHSRK